MVGQGTVLKKSFILIAGMTVLLAGLIMLVLPGPGILMMVLGVTILAIEFQWARRWAQKMKLWVTSLKKYCKKK